MDDASDEAADALAAARAAMFAQMRTRPPQDADASVGRDPLVAEAVACWEAFEHAAGPLPGLLRERRILTTTDRSVALVGAFKAGKSSIANLLLGRPLLPVGLLPTTGAVCEVRGGPEVEIAYDRAGASMTHRADPESLRSAVVLPPSTLGHTGGGGLPETVEIAAPNLSLPDGLTLIDTPGLEDSAEMAARALSGAERADVVAVVVSSQAFSPAALARTLTALRDRRGLDGVMLIANLFLTADTEAEFARSEVEIRGYCEAFLPRLRAELGLPNRSLPLLTVSARGGASKPDAFGAPALTAAIIRPPAEWAALSVRRRLAAIRRGHASVRERAAAILAELEAEHGRALAAREAAIRDDPAGAAFEETARASVADATRELQSLCEATLQSTVQRGGVMAIVFATRQTEAMAKVATRLAADIKGHVAAFGQIPLTEEAEKRLCALVSLPAEAKADIIKMTAVSRLLLTPSLPGKGQDRGSRLGRLFDSAYGAATGRRPIQDMLTRIIAAVATQETLILEVVLACRRPAPGAELDASGLERWRRLHERAATPQPLPMVPFDLQDDGVQS